VVILLHAALCVAAVCVAAVCVKTKFASFTFVLSCSHPHVVSVALVDILFV
jgi:hypothetical protein